MERIAYWDSRNPWIKKTEFIALVLWALSAISPPLSVIGGHAAPATRDQPLVTSWIYALAVLYEHDGGRAIEGHSSRPRMEMLKS